MIRGIIFDLNGTLIDILTDEGDAGSWRVLANYLDYHGVSVAPEEARDTYFELNRRQRRESCEKYPEFDVITLFRDLISSRCKSDSGMFPAEINTLAREAALVFRAATRFRLQTYPGVNEVLPALQASFRLAALSDGQALWAKPELRSVGLAHLFPTPIISSDLGFRKPDRRMFELALGQLGLKPEETIMVGNDMYRDVAGGAGAGMRTVFFKSNQGDHDFHGVEADYIIYNFNELPRAIDFLNRKKLAAERNRNQ